MLTRITIALAMVGCFCFGMFQGFEMCQDDHIKHKCANANTWLDPVSASQIEEYVKDCGKKIE